MANVEHVDITDPEIHEPKGASSASSNTVYIADGAGSGSWGQITGDELDGSVATAIQSWLDDETITIPQTVYFSAVIDDISTASTVLVPIPEDCTVVSASLVLGGAITGADASITFKDLSAASLGTAVTVPFTSSAAGDQFSFTATANNELTGPTFIQVSTNGNSTDAQKLYITIVATLG